MTMAMKVPSSSMGLVPGLNGKMKKNESLSFTANLSVIRLRRKVSSKPRPVLCENLVMVSKKQMDFSVESLKNLFLKFVRINPEGEITKVVNIGSSRNFCIPPVNKLPVHLGNRLEGTVAILDDVCVTEVGV